MLLEEERELFSAGHHQTESLRLIQEKKKTKNKTHKPPNHNLKPVLVLRSKFTLFFLSLTSLTTVVSNRGGKKNNWSNLHKQSYEKTEINQVNQFLLQASSCYKSQ